MSLILMKIVNNLMMIKKNQVLNLKIYRKAKKVKKTIMIKDNLIIIEALKNPNLYNLKVKFHSPRFKILNLKVIKKKVILNLRKASLNLKIISLIQSKVILNLRKVKVFSSIKLRK